MNGKIGSRKLYSNACNNEDMLKCYNVDAIVSKHKHNFEQEGIDLEHINTQNKQGQTPTQKVAAKIKQIRKHSKNSPIYKNSKHKVRTWLKEQTDRELAEAV